MKSISTLLSGLLFITFSYAQKSNYSTESHPDLYLYTTSAMASQLSAGASIGNTFYFFYDVGGYIQSAAYEVKNDGSLTKSDARLHGSPETDGYFSAALFNKKLYLFNLNRGSMEYNAVGPHGEDLGGGLISLSNAESPEGLAAVAVGDEIFIFYHDVSRYYLQWPHGYRRHCLKCIHSKDLRNWNEVEIDDQSQSGIVPKGPVKATACYAKDGSRRIMLLCTMATKGLGCYILKVADLLKLYVPGNNLGKFFNIDPETLSGFGVLEGSVCGAGTGDRVQLFYVTKGGLYDHGDKVYRMEYSSTTETWSQAEVLSFQMNAEYPRGLENCQPAVFPAYETVGNDRKKQVLFGYVKNVSHSDTWTGTKTSYSLQLARWDSDVLRFDSTYVENNPDPQLCTLIGVVEGPPPYVLNGESWERIENFYDASKIQYGTSSTTINETNSSWSAGFEISAGFGDESKREGKSGWFDVGGSWKWDRSTINSYETTVSQEKEIYPFKGGNDAYQLWVKPVIQRDCYKLYDWKGNDLNRHIYFFTVTASKLDWDIVDMKDIEGAPNSSDFSSFMNRKHDPQNYPYRWRADISWQEGSSSSNSLKKQNSTTYENTFTQTYKANLGVNLGLFHVSGGFEADISLKSSVTSAISEDLTVVLNSPSGDKSDNIPDTTKFAGVFYWLTPSPTLKNWWIPAGFEAHKPWCMTYKITSVNGKIVPRLAVALSDPASVTPARFGLKQNYPNPFNPLTRIEYSIPKSAYVTLRVYSVLGEEVATLFSDFLSPGNYVNTWKPSNISSGIYYYELRAGEFRQTRKMLLIK